MSGPSIDSLGYLLHHLAFVLDRQSELLLQERLDIGFSQFKILMALKWHEGVQQKDIANKLGQTEASVSRQIKLLDDVGYLTSIPSPKDRRQHITTLSAKGEALIDKALSALDDYHQPVFAELDAHEQQQLQSILLRLHSAACRSARPGGCKH